jgi:hypothetical protein
VGSQLFATDKAGECPRCKLMVEETVSELVKQAMARKGVLARCLRGYSVVRFPLS